MNWIFIIIAVILLLIYSRRIHDPQKGSISAEERKSDNMARIIITSIGLTVCLIPFIRYLYFRANAFTNNHYLSEYVKFSKGTAWIISLGIIFLILLIIDVVKRFNHYYEKEIQKEQEEHKKQEQEERETQIQEKKRYNNLIAKIQNPTKIIQYGNEYVMVNEPQSLILLNEHVFNFKDIINYNLTDSPTTIQHHNTGTATTKTSTKSMVGRAIVGDVLMGGAGAMAGALTAKKNTEIHLGDTTSTTKHDYTIVVNVNSISNPVERLHLGEEGKIANEILGVLSVIMTRNR